MSNHLKWGNELLSEFSHLITTINARIVSLPSINNAIANFCVLPPPPITLKLIFPEHLQSLSCICDSNAIKTWHSTPLRFTFIFTMFSFFHPKKSFKVRDHRQTPFLLLSKFKRIFLILSKFTFVPTWNYPKTIRFLTISGGIEVN